MSKVLLLFGYVRSEEDATSKYDPVIQCLLEARRCIINFAAAEGAWAKYMGPINMTEGYFAVGCNPSISSSFVRLFGNLAAAGATHLGELYSRKRVIGFRLKCDRPFIPTPFPAFPPSPVAYDIFRYLYNPY